MTEPRDSRLRRLADAVDIYLSNREGADTDAVLDAHGDLRDLLEPMLKAPASLGVDRPADRPADRLGDFTLLREIGRGGMGVVYEAQEQGLGRKVALKVLPPHVTLSARGIERFRREAAVLAKLQHPAIVPIYRVGEIDGTHYFAMELIEGHSLGHLLGELQAARVRGAALTLGLAQASSYVAEVVEVVAQAAEALAAAHAQGVLHRDVKPHNLLLGRDGRVRVVDFGLAKDLDRASISRSGEVAGTPHYMSPEQAQGSRDLDGRTDVFSLGVVLYELLALQLPFDGDSAQVVLQAILTREPNWFGDQPVRVPRDLEIVCRKALEKLPQDRYASCTAFAADLRRIARLEPIEARAPRAVSRVVKLMRRHKAATLAVALAFLVFVVGPLVFVSVMRHKDAEMQRHRDLAHDNFQRARRVVEQQLARVDQIARQPGMETLHRQMVEDAAQSFREFLQQDLNDPALAGQALDAQVLTARVQQQLGDLDAARKTIGEAVARAEAAAGAGVEPAQPVHVALLDALRTRAVIAESSGDVAAARADFAKAAASGEALLARAPAAIQDDVVVALARTYSAWGAAAVQRREGIKEAGAHLELASRLWLRLAGKPLATAVVYDDLDHQRVRGQYFYMVGAYPNADDVLVAARERAVAQVAANPDDPLARSLLARICAALGTARSMRGPRVEATAFFAEADAELEALLSAFPRNQSYRFMLHLSLLQHASHLRSLRDAVKALPLAERAVQLIRELAGQDPDNAAMAGTLVTAIIEFGDIADAAWTAERRTEYWTLSLAEVRGLSGRFPKVIGLQASLGACLNRLATLATKRDDWTAAMRLYAEAVEVQRQLFVAEPSVQDYRSALLFSLRQLAKCRLGNGDLTGAEAAARESLTLWPNSPENLGSFTAMMMGVLTERGLKPEAVDGPTTPPGPFDEIAAAVIKAVDTSPFYARAWRDYDRINPLLVRGDVRRAFDRAMETLEKAGKK